MAFPNQQLFLDRFIAYNKNRYKDDPYLVKAFGALTLSDIAFTNLRKETKDGVTRHVTDVDAPGVFTGENQRYIPADYSLHGVAQLVSENPLALSQLRLELEAGIYWLRTDENGVKVGALLVEKGEKNVENILRLVKGKCLYDLEVSDISIDEDISQVTIDSVTITGSLQVVESLGDINEATYDGTFIFDGTLTF